MHRYTKVDVSRRVNMMKEENSGMKTHWWG